MEVLVFLVGLFFGAILMMYFEQDYSFHISIYRHDDEDGTGDPT